MVGWEIEVREIEHIWEDIKEKLGSIQMRKDKREREDLSLVMRLESKDEKNSKES